MTHYFVRMTVTKGKAKFRNNFGRYEIFVCRWEDCGDFVKELMETDEACESKTVVAFELIESELSFEDWCIENEVDTGDY